MRPATPTGGTSDGAAAASVEMASGGNNVTAHTVSVSSPSARRREHSDSEDGGRKDSGWEDSGCSEDSRWGLWEAMSGPPMFNEYAGPCPGPPCSTSMRGRFRAPHRQQVRGAISGPLTRSSRGRRFGEGPRAQDPSDLLGVERLALEQSPRE